MRYTASGKTIFTRLCTSRRFSSVRLPRPDTNLARRSELGSYTADNSGNDFAYHVAECQLYDRRDASTRNNTNKDQCVDSYKAYDVRFVLRNGSTHLTSSALFAQQYLRFASLCFICLHQQKAASRYTEVHDFRKQTHRRPAFATYTRVYSMSLSGMTTSTTTRRCSTSRMLGPLF